MKRILITATDLMMIQFLVPHVHHLVQSGYAVDVACSPVGERMGDVRRELEGTVENIHSLRLERSPFSRRNLLGYRDLRRILRENHYDLIWTNEPVMGVMTRLAARDSRRRGTKVVYMCHGFHFFRGASPWNWALFYPVERIMSRFCDAIVTVNREDHARAVGFGTCPVYPVPGVGVDTRRFSTGGYPQFRLAKRRQLGIPEDAWVVLTVGELTKRKNQKVLLKAVSSLEKDVHLVLCGRGSRLPALERLAGKWGIRERVHFLGYRLDIPEIYRMADCFAFPSLQEGLPFALMEAMQSGLPIAASRIRGNVDLLEEGAGGILCNPRRPGEFAVALERLRRMDTDAMVRRNREKLKEFDLEHTKPLVLRILEEVLK